jgi:hypothetical protein
MPFRFKGVEPADAPSMNQRTAIARRAPNHPRSHRSTAAASDGRTAQNGFATGSGVSKSAKLVLNSCIFSLVK